MYQNFGFLVHQIFDAYIGSNASGIPLDRNFLEHGEHVTTIDFCIGSRFRSDRMLAMSLEHNSEHTQIGRDRAYARLASRPSRKYGDVTVGMIGISRSAEQVGLIQVDSVTVRARPASTEPPTENGGAANTASSAMSSERAFDITCKTAASNDAVCKS